jgi:hypothetical protein
MGTFVYAHQLGNSFGNDIEDISVIASEAWQSLIKNVIARSVVTWQSRKIYCLVFFYEIASLRSQ